MKRPSFQFYPADWRGSRWVCFDMMMPIIPNKPACYVVCLDGRLMYVGQTSDLRKRLAAYNIRLTFGDNFNTKWGFFDSVVVKAHFGLKIGDWAMKEIRLIHRLQPELNCVGSRKKRFA